tara:strand:+ start:295 stop:546 length:252 start_codon:yes stop_codon:yes gene_type:complete
MRTLLATVFGLTFTVITASAGIEYSALFLNMDLSPSLSGTTSSGFDFAEVPKTATYGLLGAGFLVLSVFGRHKHIYRIQKQKV